MITAAIITFVLSIVLVSLINLLPVIGASFVIPPEVAGTIGQVFSTIAYFIPVGGLVPMLIIVGAIDGGILAWRLILRFINFIPIPFIKGS